MMFRKLYWVTELVERDGTSQVTGVYTSIPDLVRYGLRALDRGSVRLTLTKLDADNETLGTWMSPAFRGLADDLKPYVVTEEFTGDHCDMLLTELQRLTNVAA